MEQHPFFQRKKTRTRDRESDEITLGPSVASLLRWLLLLVLVLVLILAGVNPEALLNLLWKVSFPLIPPGVSVFTV